VELGYGQSTWQSEFSGKFTAYDAMRKVIENDTDFEFAANIRLRKLSGWISLSSNLIGKQAAFINMYRIDILVPESHQTFLSDAETLKHHGMECLKSLGI
jgi:hypothetical protein